MEMKKNATRVQMRAWTPASGYSSPPSPVSSQFSWDECKDEDFQSQMDENGIIGLSETQGEQEEEVALKDEEGIISDVGTPEPEEGPPSALEDLNCHLSELLDSEPLSLLVGDDCLSPTHNDVEYGDFLEDWSYNDEDNEQKLDEENQENIHRPAQHSSPVRDLDSGTTNDEIEEIKMHRIESYQRQRNTDPQYNCMNSHVFRSNEEMDNKSDIAKLEMPTFSQNSYLPRQVSSSSSFKSTPQTHIHLLLPELSLQDEERNSRIKAETFAEPSGFNSRLSQSPRIYQPDEEPASALNISESEKSSPELGKNSAKPLQSHYQRSVSTSRDINSTSLKDYPVSSFLKPAAKDSTNRHRRHHSPSKTSHTDPNDVRKGQLSHPLPDFSKVEPKVCFPKSSYKPPKSRKPGHKNDSKSKVPVVFKTPADIVREALLSNSEAPSDTTVPINSQMPSNTTMPEELRCPLQASTMVQQLQEDYNRLLTKYAEAENTIDRLRLEAKVFLHSDPPKPSQPASSGVLKESSKVMTLSFPQAQRAVLVTDAVQPTQQNLNSATRGTPPQPSSVDSFPSSWYESSAASPLTEPLSEQMARFQLQVNEFEKLLKSGRLKPYEQTQGLSQLAQGQESIERAYLAAREKHQQLQRQTGGKSGPFDPDRELESLIFQSGIQLEELKEWIDQSEHIQRIGLTPSDPPHVLQPCVLIKKKDPEPENPPSAAHADVMVGLGVSSVSGESDRVRDTIEEDILPSVLRPLHHKHRRVEKDISNLMDHVQNFRDLSKLLDRDLAEPDHNSLEFKDHSSYPACTDRLEPEQPWRNKDKQDSDKPLHPLPMADCLSGPSCSSYVCNSMETLPEASIPVTALPRKQGSGRRAAGSMRSQSSLVERAGVGRRASKENDRALKAQLQDGVVTPETDSGFVGSESSRLTPAAQSPVQQMSAVRATRPSVVQEKCQINPKSSSPAHKEPSSNPSCAHAIAPGGVPGSLGRRGETRLRHIPSSFTSSSPLCWQSTPFQAWPSGEISEPEQQSECARSLSEDGTRQGVLHTQPSNRDPSYLTSSSFTAPYHHGDHLKAQSSGQLANHHEAIGSLQAEVHRLREHLEGTLRTATRCPSKNNKVHIPPYTSTPHLLQRDFRSLDRKTASKREPKANGGTVNGEQERTKPRRRSASVPRLRPEPDTSTDTELTNSEDMTPKYIPATPVMAHTSRRMRAETGQSPKIHTHWRKRSISADRSKVRHDEDEGRERPVHETLCSSCLARYHRSSECHARNVNSSLTTRYYSSKCPLCGAPKRDTVSPPANQSFMQKKAQPPRAKHMQPGALYMAVAPPPSVIGSVPMLQCVPVCPSVLYYSSPVVPTSYQKPFYVSLSDGRGSGGHRRRSQSVDAQRSLNRTLGRAITTASSVREMSQRMVRSLSSGLNHMSPLAKSCNY